MENAPIKDQFRKFRRIVGMICFAVFMTSTLVSLTSGGGENTIAAAIAMLASAILAL